MRERLVVDDGSEEARISGVNRSARKAAPSVRVMGRDGPSGVAVGT
jgi:hypothetical protein